MFLWLALAAHAANALDISDYNITFEIMPDTSVRESVSMAFASPLNASSLNYAVFGEISDLSVSDGVNIIPYTLEKTGDEYNVRFAAPEGTERLLIKFTANDLVFSSDNVYSFSTSLKPPEARSVSIKAFLPAGFAVYRDVIYPETHETLSDGERIYVQWEREGGVETLVSLKFYNTNSDYSLIVMAVMGFALVVIVAYLVGHYRKRMKHEFERGFSEDERRVLLILSQEKRIMQNKVGKELHFSRAKMTRLVKKLEAKGLVEKERIGRTNRLFYKK